MLAVKIKTQFEDFHNWPDAPDEVAFLRSRHRHIFYVVVKIQVLDEDRDIEYFMAKREIDKIIGKQIIPMEERKSCENMSSVILDFLEVVYPKRFIEVEVNEDNENGSVINNKVE